MLLFVPSIHSSMSDTTALPGSQTSSGTAGNGIREVVLSWPGWVAAAVAASSWHALIDGQIGLLGSSSSVMTIGQGTALAFDALLLGWWGYLAIGAAAGNPRMIGGLALMLLLEPVLFDGAVAIAVAPPPSAAFPYQDLAHSLSLLLGLVALVALRRSSGWGRWGWPSWTALALKVGGTVTSAAVFISLKA